MVFTRVRSIGRVFAVVLLAWTAADVLDYGACANHRDPFPACGPESVGGAAPADHPCHPGPPPGHAGDCFCCSPYVDVQVPFEVTLHYAVAWALVQEDAACPLFVASPLYHPPLA